MFIHVCSNQTNRTHAMVGNPSQSYRTSPVIWDHTALFATWRRHPRLAPLNPSQAGRYSIHLPWMADLATMVVYEYTMACIGWEAMDRAQGLCTVIWRASAGASKTKQTDPNVDYTTAHYAMHNALHCPCPGSTWRDANDPDRHHCWYWVSAQTSINRLTASPSATALPAILSSRDRSSL